MNFEVINVFAGIGVMVIVYLVLNFIGYVINVIAGEKKDFFAYENFKIGGGTAMIMIIIVVVGALLMVYLEFIGGLVLGN